MTDPILESESLDWLLQSATDAMLIADAQDGSIVLANPPAERLFGYDSGSLHGLPIESLVPQHSRREHASLRAGYASQPKARGMGAGMELFACRRDGSEFPVEVSLSPLKTPSGRMLVMASVHDISYRKQAEAALQESEARMRAIFETAVDAIVIIDEHGMIERINPAAERVFGYAEAEVAQKNVSMLMPSPYREMHDGYLEHYMRTGERRIIGIGREVVGLRKNGSVFPMELSVAEMRIGDRRMFTGMVRDISERKQAEEQRERLMHELSSANEELTNFAYVVSHDLKAPLRAIGSLADWLSTDYSDKFDAEGKEHMKLLISRVHRMGALIDGILQYSRVGRVREALATVDLRAAVSEAVGLLAPPAHIRVKMESDFPVIRCEPTRIQQLFQNLVSNSIKYMDKPQGEIRIGCTEEERHWRFWVADNGPGIDQRHFERIFQLFQTLAPRDRIESTGVGLSLVKKIVEMYGGKVWVESAPGAGSTFHFTLPKTMAALPADRAAEGSHET